MNDQNQDKSQNDWAAPSHQPPPAGNFKDYRPPQDHLPQQQNNQNNPGGLSTDQIIALVLSFLIPGVGQIMMGQTAKGLVILAVAIVTGCGGGLISIASVLDAFLLIKAKEYRQVGDWEFFPDFNQTFGSK
ncbi:hypothetical protein DV096_11820 [Bradymonadaceae bacterium TMQ3]|uniref:TM2 domain-containing protein n=1 Tax=Lujinxingia sediminis TaxID=2480984 RepID=A0ABY0CSE0_9DELT|nr:hypothetical protein [Lujinxingia sediminis]RDV37798.1 hypothetical protein DV096_11820 [Bradymonadaceae bacterium TMQ3]RVU43203.1 hypothetical protein EA187_13410 [Lujinxingia sediminis]TXC75418.1 hypothetical protein FRC91_11930 [Bradymonadales bacterium TMQ1]